MFLCGKQTLHFRVMAWWWLLVLGLVLIDDIPDTRGFLVHAFTTSSAHCRVVTAFPPTTSRLQASSKTQEVREINEVKNTPLSSSTIGTTPATAKTLQLTTMQVAQTVAYRASLLVFTLVYSADTVLPVLQNAGLSFDNDNIMSSMRWILLGTSAIATAVAPKASAMKMQGTRRGVTLLDGKVLAASVATVVAGTPLVGVAALLLREVYYFGVAYKVEAVVGLLAIIAQWGLAPNNNMASAVLCLALGVLIGGKALEPLVEDWQPNQSEFLAQTIR